MDQEISNLEETPLIIPLNLRMAGINTFEKLASMEVEDLLNVNGVDRTTAIRYLEYAREYVRREYPDKLRAKKFFSERLKGENNDETMNMNKNKVDHQKSKENKVIKKDVKIQMKEQTTHKSSYQKRGKNSKKPKKKKQEYSEVGYIDDIYPEEIIQKIRFLHFKIKKIEEAMEKKDETFNLDDLKLIDYYVDILNINYKLKNQNLILRELGLTSTYYDLLEKESFIIYDVMFECARVLWVLARAYTEISEKYEEEEDLENAILAMIKCSKAYKSAAYFSAASVNQLDRGKSLDSENLEYKSEESRIIAQSLAALREENNNHLDLSSQLYAGLSALSKRMLYLKEHKSKVKNHLIGQSYFDLGKSCYLKALSLQKSIVSKEVDEEIIPLIKDYLNKASYYYHKSEEIWEDLLKTEENNLEKEEINRIRINLSIVNDSIIECKTGKVEYDQIKDVMDPEPYIIIPENLAHVLPKTTVYLSQISSTDMNVDILKKYKNKKLEDNSPDSKRKLLLSKKAGIGRTIKELKTLYKNNDIDVDTYANLLEKYNTKIKDLDIALDKIDIN